MNKSQNNIFSLKNIAENLPEEVFEDIIKTDNVKIERIISQGHTTSPDKWYDQELHEWVIIIQGQAELIFENNDSPVSLEAGDYINIPAHTKHRVSYTSNYEKTIWLAIFYKS